MAEPPMREAGCCRLKGLTAHGGYTFLGSARKPSAVRCRAASSSSGSSLSGSDSMYDDCKAQQHVSAWGTAIANGGEQHMVLLTLSSSVLVSASVGASPQTWLLHNADK